MPTYEFRCPNGHVTERRLKMSEAASEISCPECGEVATRQLSGGAGLVFKGSGFYLTDYGRNAHRGSPPPSGESAKKESSGETKSASPTSETKSESKPKESKPSPSSTPSSSSGGGTKSES